MTDLEKDKILLLAHSIGKMARELQSIKRLLEEIADTPQTDKADRIPYDPLVEMDIKRMVEARLRQTETSTNSEKLQSGVELKQPDCP